MGRKPYLKPSARTRLLTDLATAHRAVEEAEAARAIVLGQAMAALPAAEITAALGVSRATIYRWAAHAQHLPLGEQHQ